MSDFWLGVFAGLTVWKAFDLLASLMMFGETVEIDKNAVARTAGFTVVFGLIAWYLATFGGM